MRLQGRGRQEMTRSKTTGPVGPVGPKLTRGLTAKPLGPTLVSQPSVSKPSPPLAPSATFQRKPTQGRAQIKPMDPGVETHMRRAEFAEQERQAAAKQAKMVRRQGPPPPPPVPVMVERRETTRPKFVERVQPSRPIQPGGPSQSSIISDVQLNLKSLRDSILDMFALQYLDQREFKSLDTVNEVLTYVRDNMAPKRLVVEIEGSLKRILDAAVRTSLKEQYDWMTKLAALHRTWIELQLAILRNMRDISQRRDRLRCDALEIFAKRFTDYLHGLDELIVTATSGATGEVKSALQKYLSLPLGIDPRIQVPDPMDKLSAVWFFLIGRDPQIFSQLFQSDVNCTRADGLRILEHLENAAQSMISLADRVLGDEKRKVQWQEYLRRIQDEMVQIRSGLESEEAPIDYSDLLRVLGSQVAYVTLEEI